MNNDEDKNQSQNEINNVQTNDQQFDPSHLKLSQNFSELVGVKRFLQRFPLANLVGKILYEFTPLKSIAWKPLF